MFAPTSGGVKTATVHIHSNDCDEPDFDFVIQGGVPCAPPTVTITSNVGTSSCGPVGLRLTAHSSDPNVTYHWFSGSTNPFQDVNVFGSSTFCCTVINAAGCSTSACITIIINPIPVVSIIDSGCCFKTIASGTTPYLSYLWDNGETTPTICPPVPGEHTVGVTDLATGCYNAATHSSRISAGNDTSICRGSFATLKTRGSVTTSTWYVINAGNLVLIPSSGNEATVNPIANTYYVTYGCNAAGCCSYDTILVKAADCCNKCDTSNYANSLIINTGYDKVTGTALPLGVQDNNWKVINAPSWATASPCLMSASPTPPAWTIPEINPWEPSFTNSRWISGCTTNASLPNNAPPLAPFTFEYDFCLCHDDSVTFNMQSHYDDSLLLYIDNHAYSFVATYSGNHVEYFAKIFLPKGKHHLRGDLRNLGTLIMGFDLTGSISGNFVSQFGNCDEVLTVNAGPDQIISSGATAVLTATGCTGSLQWYQITNGTGIPLAGQTSPNLSVTPSSPTCYYVSCCDTTNCCVYDTVCVNIAGSCPNSLVQNGGFTNGFVGTSGDLGSSATTNNWSAATNSPQIIKADGCQDSIYIRMWGIPQNAESIQQIFPPSTKILEGHTYSVSYCARWNKTLTPSTAPQFVQFLFRASNNQVTDNSEINQTGINAVISKSSQITNVGNWVTYQDTCWVADADYSRFTASVTNTSTINNGIYVSWGEIDNICLTECACDATANAGPDITTCAGQSTTLTTATGSGYTYEWKVLGTTTVIGTQSSLTVAPVVSTCYILKVNGAGGCYRKDTVCITVTNCCINSLLQNGDFTNGFTGTNGGNLGGGTTISNWTAATNTPQVLNIMGCQDNGYIRMWGIPQAAESIQQTLQASRPITEGHKYKVSYCARWNQISTPPTAPQFVQFLFRASNNQLNNNSEINQTGISSVISKSGHITNVGNWATYEDSCWIADANYTRFTASVTNTSTINDGIYVSWGEIDNICLTECPCDVYVNVGPDKTICTGQSTTLTSATGSGYTYEWKEIGSTTVLGTQVSLFVSPGITTCYVLKVTSAEGCYKKDTVCVTVHSAAVSPYINGYVNVCPYVGTNIPVTYTATSTGATGFTWLTPANVTVVSGAGTANLTVTFQSGFTAQPNKQIRVTALSPCGNSSQTIYYLAAQAPNTPSPISGTTSVCSVIGTAGTLTFTIPSVPGASAYIWAAQAGTTTISHPNGPGANDTTVTVSFSNGFSASNITVAASNGCGTSQARSLALTRVNPSTPGLISGPTNACAYMAPGGTAANYSIVPVAGAASYTWTVPAGAIGLTGQGTNSISFIYPNNFASGTITVTATNGCGTGVARSQAIGKLNPATPGVIDVIQTVQCPNRIYTYTLAAMPANATSVQWTVPATSTLVSGQGTNSITVAYPPTGISGNITAQSFNNCGGSSIRTTAVKLPACPPPAGKNLISSRSANAVSDKEKVVAQQMTVIIYPNPSTKDFNMQVLAAGKEKINVTIMDAQGRVIKSFTVLPHKSITFGSDLKAGTYLAEIRQDAHLKTMRLVKL